MIKELKLITNLKLHQTKIKHLCVSDDKFINKLINKPYEALLQANVDIGGNRVYVNVAPLFSYIDRGAFTSVVGLKIFFFIGKNALLDLDEYFSQPVHLGTWHTGVFSTSWHAPQENFDLDKLASLSIKINGYGFEKGKLLNKEYFEKLNKKQQLINAEKKAKEDASGYSFLKSNDVYKALEDFFYIHKPYNIDGDDGGYIFDYRKIGLKKFKINIKCQTVFMQNTLVEKYEEDGDTPRSIPCAADFRIPVSQFSDLFMVNGSFVTEIFEDAAMSSSFQDEGISKQDIVNSLRAYWVHRKDWDELPAKELLQSEFEFVFNNAILPVNENHNVVHRINEEGTGLVYKKWVGGIQHASPEPQKNPKLLLSEDDKGVVEKFIRKFMVRTEIGDDEIPF